MPERKPPRDIPSGPHGTAFVEPNTPEASSPSGTVIIDSSASSPKPAAPISVERELSSAPVNPALRLDPAAADPDLTSEHPGRYAMTAPLGAGGMGQVFAAWDNHLLRTVALKQLRAEFHSGSEASGSGSRGPAAERFVNEARVTGRLEHPSIPPVYELGRRADGSLYYTMRVVDGRTLREAIDRAGDQGRLALLPTFLDLCNAVAYAHEHGVVHRDLKPDNVMLGNFGETVVLDWGLAKAKGERDIQGAQLSREIQEIVGASGQYTMEGTIFGTPAYMSPEQGRGAVDEIDERSDVYSLGAILYELLSGRPPHVGATGQEVVKKLLEEPIVPVAALAKSVPEELAAICMRALEKDSARRYANAGELARDVQAFLTGELVGAHRYGAWDMARRWLRRHRLALLIASLGVVIAASVWVYRGYQETRRAAAAELARRAAVERRVDELIDGVAKKQKAELWLETTSMKLVALKEPVTEKRLIRALADESRDVRQVAAHSLAAMPSRDVVDALVARLAKDVEKDPSVLIEVITSLGIIGDWRAEAAVADARKRAGMYGQIWKGTEVAYRMIPLPPLPTDRELTADEWVTRGLALHWKGEKQAALGAYEQAIHQDPKLVKAYVDRAITRRGMGDEDGALADYDAAIRLDPKNVHVLNNRAIIRRDRGDLQGALADLDIVVASKAFPAPSRRNRAKVRARLGDIEGAVADIQEARRIDPKSSMALTTLAEVWWERNDWDKTIAACDEAVKLNPKDSWARQRRASAQWSKGDLEGARTTLDEMLQLVPEDDAGRTMRAALRLDLGDHPGAKVDADFAVDAKPSEPSPRALRAVFFHARQGDWGAAEADFDAALARSEGQSHSLSYVVERAFVVARKDRARAKQLLSRQKAPEGNAFDAWVARLAMGKAELSEVEKRASYSTFHCDARLAAGLAAELSGDTDKAIELYRSAAELVRPSESACALAALGVKALAR